MNINLQNSRSNFDKLGTVYKNAIDIIVEKEIIGNVDCWWFYKKEMNLSERIIIYLHGGCFVLGSVLSHQALVSHIAHELNRPVLFIEYRLAPEHPFPDAINDILNVYQSVLYRKDIPEIIFMGDSAGAGLSMSVISMLNKKNSKQPGKLVMISPWVDLSCSNKSITSNAATDPILTKEQLQAYTSLYLGDKKLSDANPIETMFGSFPPTLILVGSGEILLDDSKLAYSKISGKQPLTKLKIYNDQTHVWLLDDIQTDASKNAMEEMRNFIND